MAVLTIPTRTDLGAYTFQIELDDKLYRFTMQFNHREGYWYMSIADESGNDIRTGVKIVSNFPLLRRVANIDSPAGEIMALDTTDADADAGLEDLGDTILLTYVEEGSVPA